MLLTPVVGVFSAAAMIGEAIGLREMLALALTLSGVSLAARAHRRDRRAFFLHLVPLAGRGRRAQHAG
jgi:hypothetical protein